MLDVRKLRALREVALRQSFSDAAGHLGYTQSAISQQVAQLERQVGTQLLDRRGRTLRLTPAGRALVDCADAILRRIVDAEAELEAITGARQHPLRTAALDDSSAVWLPCAVKRFLARYPAAQVSFSLADPETAATLLDSGELDVAVGEATNCIAPITAVAVVALFDEAIRVVLPVEHPLAAARWVSPRDILDSPWILPPSPSLVAEIFTELCAREGIRPRTGMRVGNPVAVHGMVAAGLGIAFLPAALAALGVREDVVVRPFVPPEPTVPVVALVRAGIERSPAITGMLHELRALRATTSQPRANRPPGAEIPRHPEVEAG
jgi:DNA-binding transcriptional LysR family regulator